MIDIALIILLLLGGFIGAQRGFTQQLVHTVGTIAVIILAFIFKTPLAYLLYKTMPFLNFSGSIEGITSLNLLLYALIAFLLIFLVLSAVLVFLKRTTKFFEKLLKLTLILGIPSKILGAIVGVINNAIYIFIAIYFLSLPVFNFTPITESKLANTMLNNTPILSSVCSKTLEVFIDIDQLVDEYRNEKDAKYLNQATLQLLVDKKIITKKVVNELIASGKLTNVSPIG